MRACFFLPPHAGPRRKEGVFSGRPVPSGRVLGQTPPQKPSVPRCRETAANSKQHCAVHVDALALGGKTPA